MQILDGTGSGYGAKVDTSHKLRTRSVISSEQNEEAAQGNAFLISSGFVTLTSAAESALLYIRNDEDQDLVITRFLVSARNSTGGTTNHAVVTLYSNPTGISSAGTPLSPANLNFGSTNDLANTSELGQTGATVTGGSAFGGFVIPVEGLVSETSSIILPKGASLAATCIPPAGNTSFTIGVGMNAHLVTQGTNGA